MCAVCAALHTLNELIFSLSFSHSYYINFLLLLNTAMHNIAAHNFRSLNILLACFLLSSFHVYSSCFFHIHSFSIMHKCIHSHTFATFLKLSIEINISLDDAWLDDSMSGQVYAFDTVIPFYQIEIIYVIAKGICICHHPYVIWNSLQLEIVKYLNLLALNR